MHLHDGDVTVEVLSDGAAENVGASTHIEMNTIGIDELGSTTRKRQPL
jgi:hypothetical protein